MFFDPHKTKAIAKPILKPHFYVLSKQDFVGNIAFSWSSRIARCMFHAQLKAYSKLIDSLVITFCKTCKFKHLWV